MYTFYFPENISFASIEYIRVQLKNYLNNRTSGLNKK